MQVSPVVIAAVMVRHCAEIYSINFNLILISLPFLSLMRRCVVNNATTTTAFPSGDMGIAVDVSGANYDYYYCHYYFCTSIHMGLFFRLFSGCIGPKTDTPSVTLRGNAGLLAPNYFWGWILSIPIHVERPRGISYFLIATAFTPLDVELPNLAR